MNNFHNGPNPNGGMHPDDKRNLILFFALCLGAFFMYDMFIHKPKMRALEAERARLATVAPEAVIDTTPLTREQALEASPRIAINNPDLSGSFTTKGGRIDDLSFKQYYKTVERKEPVELFSPARTEHPLYADFGWLAAPGTSAALPGNDTQWRVSNGAQELSVNNPVTMTWSNGQGLNFERVYALDEHYMFTITQRVTNQTAQAVTLHPYGLLSQQGLPADFEPAAILHLGPMGFFDGELEEIDYDDLEKKTRYNFTGEGWAGFSDKYWFSGLINRQDAPASFRFMRVGHQDKPVYQIDMTGAAVTVAPGQTSEVTILAYTGPKKLDLLNDYKTLDNIPRFDLVIDFGILWFLTIPFYYVLTWLGTTVGSFAIAILLFTCILRLAVFPLANKSYRAFARMRKIQPEMLAIREKYGDDRMRLQAAIFELYKRENVNPMAGCLPILIQIPIFFALYKVLYITLEMRHAPFWGWIQDMSAPDPTSVLTGLGLIPVDLPSFLTIGVWPVLMGFSFYLQQRMNPPVQDPIQAKVLGLMPIMMVVFMAHFPAGLVIYWTWSNCLSLVQQYVLMRKEGVEIHFFRRDPIDKKMEEAVAKGPVIHPELEAIEGEAEEIFADKPITPPKKGKKK